MNKHNKNISFKDAMNSYTDSYNCNLKEKLLIRCFNEYDNQYFFKKRKFKKCLELEKEFQHCLVFSNEMSLNKRINYESERNAAEIFNINKELIVENKMNAMDYISGKKSQEEVLNRSENYKRKKVVEL